MARTQLRGSQIGDGTISNADIASDANIDMSKINGLSSALASSALPNQSGNAGKFLTTNGSASSWASVGGNGKSATILASSAQIIDLTIADTIYIEASGAATIIIQKYDGKFKSIVVYSTSVNTVTVAISDGSNTLKSLSLTGATTDSNGVMSCNGFALAIMGDSKAILPIDMGARVVKVPTSATIPALTSVGYVSRTNKTMKLSLNGVAESTIVIFALKSTTAPAIDVNSISKDDLMRCSDFSLAPTVQGAKMLVCGNQTDIQITGLSSYTAYSFTAYQYRDSLKYGVASGWSASAILENQKTSI